MDASIRRPAADSLHFVVRYRTGMVDGGVAWLDYSKHPASKLGLHNALLAVHDRIEILQARGGRFECRVFAVHDGDAEPLSPEGAERLFAALPHGDVKWTDLCRCLLPPVLPPAAEQLVLFPHTHTGYDDLDEHPAQHALDVAA
jgi:hypothetical protein